MAKTEPVTWWTKRFPLMQEAFKRYFTYFGDLFWGDQTNQICGHFQEFPLDSALFKFVMYRKMSLWLVKVSSVVDFLQWIFTVHCQCHRDTPKVMLLQESTKLATKLTTSWIRFLSDSALNPKKKFQTHHRTGTCGHGAVGDVIQLQDLAPSQSLWMEWHGARINGRK